MYGSTTSTHLVHVLWVCFVRFNNMYLSVFTKGTYRDTLEDSITTYFHNLMSNYSSFRQTWQKRFPITPTQQSLVIKPKIEEPCKTKPHPSTASKAKSSCCNYRYHIKHKNTTQLEVQIRKPGRGLIIYHYQSRLYNLINNRTRKRSDQGLLYRFFSITGE